MPLLGFQRSEVQLLLGLCNRKPGFGLIGLVLEQIVFVRGRGHAPQSDVELLLSQIELLLGHGRAVIGQPGKLKLEGRLGAAEIEFRLPALQAQLHQVALLLRFLTQQAQTGLLEFVDVLLGQQVFAGMVELLLIESEFLAGGVQVEELGFGAVATGTGDLGLAFRLGFEQIQALPVQPVR